MGCCKAKLAEKPALKSQPLRHMSMFSNMITTATESLCDDFEFVRIIGEGAHGQVKEMIDRKTNMKRAVKTINVRANNKAEVSGIEEISILKSLDYPGVIKIFDVYREPGCIHIITELCTGGELLERVGKNEYLSENNAAKYMLDIVSTLKYLHEAGIMHRDLKPDNIMFEDDSQSARLKIIDFGTSTRILPNKKQEARVGTAYFIAPEVLKGSYDEKCDIWSVGVILYVMLSGSPPFQGKTNVQIYQNITSSKLKFSSKVWKSVSRSAKNLIRKILVKDPDKRISVSELFYDPWIRTRVNNLIPERIIAEKSLKALMKFRRINKLQACTYAFLAHYLTAASDIKDIRLLFESFDKNGDGRLSREEINEGLHEHYSYLNINIEEILKNCDIDDNGYLDYSEFLTAVIYKNIELSKKNLRIAFDAIDLDGNGRITLNELKLALVGITTEVRVQELIDKYDQDGDGELNINEFTAAIININSNIS